MGYTTVLRNLSENTELLSKLLPESCFNLHFLCHERLFNHRNGASFGLYSCKIDYKGVKLKYSSISILDVFNYMVNIVKARDSHPDYWPEIENMTERVFFDSLSSSVIVHELIGHGFEHGLTAIEHSMVRHSSLEFFSHCPAPYIGGHQNAPSIKPNDGMATQGFEFPCFLGHSSDFRNLFISVLSSEQLTRININNGDCFCYGVSEAYKYKGLAIIKPALLIRNGKRILDAIVVLDINDMVSNSTYWGEQTNINYGLCTKNMSTCVTAIETPSISIFCKLHIKKSE
jgi:hypothetical protein